MAAVLGVSAYYHDSAAALVVDGHVVCAAQEERLSRVKNDPSFPEMAINLCLSKAGLNAEDINSVVFYENPFRKVERVLRTSAMNFPFGVGFFRNAVANQATEKLWIIDRLAEYLGLARSKVSFVSHHESHAASAFFPNPFQESAVLTVDGVGEDVTTALWHGSGNELKCISELHYPHSLGLFYAALTSFLGFRVNEGEYKVMGLAGFGKPRFESEFQKLLTLNADASFELGLDYFGRHLHPTQPYASEMVDLLGPPRDRTRPWNLSSTEDQRYADIAATTQEVTERVMVALANRVQRETGLRSLCLAGGVALNVAANRRILEETEFEDVFVQPAAGDAGGALGAALLGARSEGDSCRATQRPGWGSEPDVARAQTVALSLGLRCEEVDSAKRAARDIVAGRIVAWVEGPFEFGPRALGNRSLLARADNLAVRDRLNQRVKGREAFRPFAPAMLEENAFELTGRDPDSTTKFMTSVRAIDQEEPLLGAIHVDGTARLQTVERNTPFGALLGEVDLLGQAAVINTSLNSAGQPIAGSEVDAMAFLLAHPIDALYVGNLRIERT